MDESIKEQLEYFQRLRDDHLCYMKQHLERFQKLHNELSQAITNKIAELKEKLYT